MQDSDLQDAVKALLLKHVDDQCKKSEESSSVLRLPRSKHKVCFKLTKIIGDFPWIG